VSLHIAAVIEALTDPTRRMMRNFLSSSSPERQEILEALISIATDLIAQEGAWYVKNLFYEYKLQYEKICSIGTTSSPPPLFFS
jgi:hypothetical protein